MAWCWSQPVVVLSVVESAAALLLRRLLFCCYLQYQALVCDDRWLNAVLPCSSFSSSVLHQLFVCHSSSTPPSLALVAPALVAVQATDRLLVV